MTQEAMSRRGFVANSLVLGAGLWSPSLAMAAAEPSEDWAQPREAAGIDSVAVRKILDDAGSVTVLRSILVVKDGVLVGERYYGGANASDLQGINSVTKSVASMLIGMAVQQGRIRSLSDTVATLLPAAAAKAPGAPALAITLEQILTGTSGLVYDFRTGMQALDRAEDPLAYVLGLPVDPQQVGRWVYNDAAVSLLSPMLVEAHGMPVDQLAQRDLFGPLGITHIAGMRDKAGNFLSYRGLRLRARDLAKLAWTMANDGRWGDRQLVPMEWVRDSTSSRAATTWRVAPLGATTYGYLWFRGQLSGHPVFFAWGYGAQFALVAPSLRLAVTTTAANPSPRDLDAQNSAVMSVVARILSAAG
jgi:CubicO group peptidase (beta-lactamase class C family)